MVLFSIFKSTNGRPLGKCFSFRDGELACRTQLFSTGTVRRGQVDLLTQFATVFDALQPDEVVSFGLCKATAATVVPKAQLADHSGAPNVIARLGTEFFWSDGPGVLVLDYDLILGQRSLTPEELVALTRRLVPELSDVTIAHKASSSSNLQTTDGQQLLGLRGQHLFIVVNDARIIPALGKIINQRAWLAGFGRYLVTKSGRLLEKSLFDASVWKPEHLVFHHAHCEPGLEQHLLGLRIFAGTRDAEEGEGWFDENLLPTLSRDELVQLEEIKRDALERARPTARQKREQFIAERISGLREADSVVEDARQRLEAALEEDRLPAEFELQTADGETVCVAELLEHPKIWDGKRFADPLEPTYRNDNRIAVAELLEGRRPSIYSHAHGGIRYWLTDIPVSGPEDFEDLTQKPEEEGRLPVLSAAEFARGAPPAWLVKGLLPKRSLTMIYGPSGSGKTFLALDLVWSIVTGKVWRGHKVAKGRVVYVVAEGRAGFRKRLLAKAAFDGPNLEEVDLGVVEEGVDFRAGRGGELADWVNLWGGAILIVVDTLAQVVAGADENSGEDMGPVIQRCNAISAATGATILLVHHAGKDLSRGARGWSGIRAAMDTEIQVARQDSCFTAKVTKQKDGEEGQSFPFSLTSVDLGKDDDGEVITSCIVHHLEAAQRRPLKPRGKWQKFVLEELERLNQFGPTSVASLSKACRSAARQPEMITRAIRNLMEDGVLIEAGGFIRFHTPTINTHNDDLRFLADHPLTPHDSKECGVVGAPLGSTK